MVFYFNNEPDSLVVLREHDVDRSRVTDKTDEKLQQSRYGASRLRTCFDPCNVQHEYYIDVCVCARVCVLFSLKG